MMISGRKLCYSILSTKRKATFNLQDRTMSTLKVIMKSHAKACQCLKSLGIPRVLGTNGASGQGLLAVPPIFSRRLTTNKDIEENLKYFQEGKFEKIPDSGHLEHFRSTKDKQALPSDIEKPPVGIYSLPHPIWTEDQLHDVHVTHKTPESKVDKMAYFTVQTFRKGFDVFSGFLFGERNERKWLNRISFLETVTGVPRTKQALPSDIEKPPVGIYSLPHPIWTEDQLHDVHVTHKTPEGKVDKMAYFTVQTFRKGFDVFSGFLFGERTERKWLNRICFLETVAGVPGMLAAMVRHMQSLRRLQRDFGWIHTLLEEAENERMHLLTAIQLRQPSLFFRMAVFGSQGVFVTMFGISYIFSPRFCHRFVGYLEEEAVKTYTKCLQDIEDGSMQHWKTQAAPDVAIRYWKLESDATMKDVILAIRADEAHHRVVNHTLASMKADDFNPYKPGK